MAEREFEGAQDEKELLSFSPDSGIGLDGEEIIKQEDKEATNIAKQQSEEKTQSASHAPPPYQSTLNPFVYRYHGTDNRKLTLLKSLSQDSEYSLDGSLFDAEEFLQDLGFAGTVDPTIPERFLPSLMQRLSKFPESEMQSLNERIVQSIGSFRRKEGKRRLFRNLSMGKDSLHENYGRDNLLPSVNSYPLHRSNTGPASYAYDEEQSTVETGSQTRDENVCANKISRESSISDETKLPQSPVAILVSQASIDYPNSETDLEEHFETLDDEKSNSALRFKVPSVDSQNCSLIKDDSFNNCSQIPEKEHCHPNIIKDLNNSPNDALDIVTPKVTCKESNHDLVDENFPFKDGLENKNFNGDVIDYFCPIVKTPLRRASSPQSSDSIDRLSNILKKSSASISNSVPSNINDPMFYIGDGESSWKDIPDPSKVIDEKIKEKPTLETQNEIFENNAKQSSPLDNPPYLSKSMKCQSEINLEEKVSSSKMYSRSHSLSNFLTSMLHTEDELSCKTNDFCRNSDILETDNLNNVHSDEIIRDEINENHLFLHQTVSESDPDIELSDNFPGVNAKPLAIASEVKKDSNRKRRMLRKMSSSLEFPDYLDGQEVENSPDSPVHTHSIESFASLSSPICTHRMKQPFRKTLSDSLSIMKRHHIPVYKVKSCDCAGFNRPKSLYEELMEVKNVGSELLYNKQCSLRKKSQIKRKRIGSCPPHLIYENCENPHVCTSCLSESSHCFKNQTVIPTACPTTKFLNQDIEVPSTKHPFAKCDTNNANDQRKSPLATIPATTKDFFPSRSKLTKSKPVSSSSHDMLNDIPFQNSNSTINGFVGDSKIKSGNPFRSRLHRLQCISGSYSTFFNESIGQEDDVFSPQTPITNCCPCSCSGKVENKFFVEKVPSQGNGETVPSVIHYGNISSSPNTTSTTVIPFNNIASSTNTATAVYLDNIALSPDTTGTTLMHCDKAASNAAATTVMHNDSFSSTPNLTHANAEDKDKPSIFKHNNEVIKPYSKTLPISKSFPYIKIKSDSISGEKSFSPNEKKTVVTEQNKREAMQEKKIHIFSKFLANLNKLSASNTFLYTPEISNFIGETSADAKTHLHISDKQEQSNSNRKCYTPPPDFDKLYLPNSIDLEKDASNFRKQANKVLPECIYKNEVCFDINSAVGNCEKPFYSCSLAFPASSVTKERPNLSRTEDSSDMNSPISSKNKVPFKGVSKDLEELQASIQKAKETRISASRELNFLQELLSGETVEEQLNMTSSKQIRLRNERGPMFPRSFSSDVLYVGVDNVESSTALSDLREKSKREVLEDTEFWHQELEKVKKENEQTWQERLQRMENKLRSQEEELIRIQSENEQMQRRLEERTSPCQCKSDSVQNGFLRIDSAFEDDDEFFNLKSSSPTLTMKQEMDRLQDKLTVSEQKSDELNLLLNQKLIELNKLQITFSKQTKEMIELEKAYLQLQFRYRKNASKPVISRLCSKASPFSSKNLFPKSSPPATPVPTGICP